MLVDKYNQWTPIFYAAAEGHIECAKVLLASGKCKVSISFVSHPHFPHFK